MAIESEYEQMLTERKIKIEGILEETKSQSKRIVVLEGQLHREQLLHEQTKHFYAESVDMLTKRESIAKNEWEETNISVERDISALNKNITELLQRLEDQKKIQSERDELIQKMENELTLMRQKLSTS